MKKSVDFNNISDELRKEYTLKPGDVRIFEVLGIHEDKEGNKRIPSMVFIPNRDTIFDKPQNEFVDIANLVTAFPSPDGKYSFKDIIFTRRGNGMISCNGRSAIDRELYMYLALCNYNKSNPDRDPAIKPLFRELNVDAESRAKLEVAAGKTKLQAWLFEASVAQVKALGLKLGIRGWKVISELKVQIMGVIDSNPDHVSGLITDVERAGDMPELVQSLLDSGLIKYSGSKHAWVYSSGEGKIKPGVRGAKKPEQLEIFAEWLNSEEGSETAEALRDLLNS